MAKLKFKGLEEYELQLMKIRDGGRICIGQAIYKGAGIIADQVKANIQALPIDNRIITKTSTVALHGISTAQKQGLLDGFGIAKLEDDGGYRHVKLGFDGYNSVVTRKYPGGQPNSVIARSVNSGTSFRARIPFVDSAISQKKGMAEEAMKEAFDEALKQFI